MRDYELTLVVNPEVAEEEVKAIVEKVNQFVTQKGGSVVETNSWGRKKLAYPIHHFGEGNYVLTRLKLEPKFTTDLEANLRLLEQIMRHLLVRVGG